MATRTVGSKAIQQAADDKGPMYVSFANNDEALKQHAMPEETCVTQEPGFSTAAADPVNIHMRAGFNRFDRANARPDDTLSMTDHKDIIKACQSVYKRIGIVRNIIDLMADFASEGLDLVHPVRSQQQFYQEWARRTDLNGRVQDFMRLMLRDANVIVRRKLAKITMPALKQMRKGAEEVVPEAPEKVRKEKKQTTTRTVPWKYTFISPTIVDKVGGELGRFYGASALEMKISPQLARAIINPKNAIERELVAKLPPEVVAAARSRKKSIILDPSKVFVAHYKKDDWEDWSVPFLYSVLDDILFKDKMRLADIAALDGVINLIRVWKLGKSDKQILPTKNAVSKLLNILQNNVGGGVLDIVWDDMIDLQVEVPPIDKILGPEKYQSVNSDIVRGLGIPDSLLGGSDLSTRNAQTAFVQLKTLVERLEYVRDKTIEWLNAELRLVADAMGFRKLPTVVFGTMNLRDEAAEKSLVIQLLDRGIVSVETVHKVFGHNFLIELEHLREEQAIREQEPSILERANPYYRPGTLIELQTDQQIRLEREKAKLAAKYAPTEAPGDKGGGDNPSGDQPRSDSTPSGPGRPANKPSTKPRDQRTPKTLSRVYEAIAHRHLAAIDTVMDPLYLASKGLKSIRGATGEQRAELENVKWSVLCCLKPQDPVSEETIRDALGRTGNAAVATIDDLYRKLVEEFVRLLSKNPSVEDRRCLMASAWATAVAEGE